MEKSKANDKRVVSLRTIILIMVPVSALIYIFLFYSMYHTSKSYNGMRADTEKYTECQESLMLLREGSEYLTARVRSFTANGNPEQAILYFNEVTLTRRRNIATEQIHEQISDERILNHIDNALKISDGLIEIEAYAMRLYISGKGDDLDQYPEQLRGIVLRPEDAALTPEEQLSSARNMVFDDNYEAMTGQIMTRIALSETLLKDTLLSDQIENSNRLARLIRSERLLIGALMLSLLLLTILIFVLVIRPLRRFVISIGDQQTVTPAGTSELQFLARTYNRMFEQSQDVNKRLSYEASHDALTGLYNRNAYDRMRRIRGDENSALLIIDVDRFKEINDSFGHDVGDKVLRRVSNALQQGFRSTDLVCRIGGDEFSIIMAGVDSSMTGLLREKIRHICQTLSQPLDEIPAVTLSVGIAFSDTRDKDEDLFKCADMALYRIKESGRAGCGFHHLRDVQ